MQCQNTDSCPTTEVHNVNEPSLYDQRNYDQHENSARCYQNNPVPIVEKFDTSFTAKNIFMWIFIALIVLVLGYFGYTKCFGKKVINMKYVPEATITNGPPMNLD